jgi:hypothetical protein
MRGVGFRLGPESRDSELEILRARVDANNDQPNQIRNSDSCEREGREGPIECDAPALVVCPLSSYKFLFSLVKTMPCFFRNGFLASQEGSELLF